MSQSLTAPIPNSYQQPSQSSQQGQMPQSMQQGVPVGLAPDVVQEMQKLDPQSAQAFSDAINKGDFDTAKKIYDEFRRNYKDFIGIDMTGMDPKLAEEINRDIKLGNFKSAKKLLEQFEKARKRKPTGFITLEDLDLMGESSFFERTLSGEFPSDILKDELKQFGYDLFQKNSSQFTPSVSTPVGPDYIIGPGDQLVLTLWGTAEGIFTVTVSKEGNVTLPKVGVVPISGVRFGDIEHTLRRHLSKYYANFNLSVSIGKLKSISVYIVGEVVVPGSYSVSSLTTVYGALVIAGGPTKLGSLRSVQVVRGGKVIKTIDLYNFLLKGDRSQDIRLQHEDTVFVPIIGPLVGVAGAVYRKGIYELKGNETIGDALNMAGGILPIGFSNRLQVLRYSNNQKKIVVDVKLSKPNGNDTAHDPALDAKVNNMDVINILPINDSVWETVNVKGEVRQPGDYQWRPDLKFKEIILEAQLLPTSDPQSAEIVRLSPDMLDRKVIHIDLKALLQGDESQNIALLPKDQIRVYTSYRDVEKVIIKGEVLRPGEYDIYRGERLSDLIRRVGGFTPGAYPYGAVYKRKDVKTAQSKNMQQFIAKMQSQVLQQAAGSAATAVSTEEAQFAKSELQLNQGLLDNLKGMQEQMEGRVAINITTTLDAWAGTKDDLILQDGDTITIPNTPQEVLVLGEIHSPGAQVFVPGLKVGDYISQAGGETNYSDRKQIYVLQANGFAYSSDSPDVGNVEKVQLKAGDAIFVPQKTERYAAMRFTKDIIDIIFKTAVTMATISIIF
ncbi:MAG: SLBB domain-containing protein [Nitrospiraceae bacterium]|nr:SLBB domain-containing protein [Nitrospiraceae bacterium]